MSKSSKFKKAYNVTNRIWTGEIFQTLDKELSVPDAKQFRHPKT